MRSVTGRRGLRARGAFPLAERLLELRDDGAGGDVAGDDEDGVRGTVLGRVKRRQIGRGDRLERRRRAHRSGAVAVRRAEHEPRKGGLDQLLGVVFHFEQRRQALLAQPLQLRLRERGVGDDVRHDRQRVREPRGWHVQIDVRRIRGPRRRELRAEKIDRVGDLEGIARAGPLVEHVGRQAGEAELAWRIRRDTGTDGQGQVDGGHLVDAHDPDLKPVRQRPFLDRRQRQRRQRAKRRRLRPIGRLLGEHGRHQQCSYHGDL